MIQKSKIAILVVEDDEPMRTAISSCLQTGGYFPIGVSNVREATAKIKNQKFSCILLDMRLGQENGEEVITFIRARKDNPNFESPILVISGFLEKSLVQTIAGQVQGALVKPFQMSELLERVAKVIK